MKDKDEEKAVLSRRQFLKDAGIVLGTSAVGSAALLSACGTNEITKTDTVTKTSTVTKNVTTTVVEKETLPLPIETENGRLLISFTVNGKKFDATVEPRETLHHLLHEQLGFKSVKTFCSRGGCGSCSVLLDGRPVLSCMTFASSVGGKDIWTSDGIGKEMPELIEAYIDNECMQCGYCTPGFIVTAAALLKRNGNPSTDEIREALAGNLCRCGTYPVHIKAVHEAASAMGGK
jgi:aerobic-type carbon monoxide dehydrogenase small subunit (CoxS/CutS family)